MLPSILPSINSDSEPVISPLMNRPLPMVAWSPPAATGARLAGSTAGAGGTGREAQVNSWVLQVRMGWVST